MLGGAVASRALSLSGPWWLGRPMGTTPPWWIALLLIVALPSTTIWWMRGSPTPDIGVLEAPLFVMSVGVLAVIALWVAGRDRWLGCLGAYVAIRVLWTRTPFAFETAQAFIFGLVLLCAASHTPARWRPWVVKGLRIAGLVQLAEVLVQWGVMTWQSDLWASAARIQGTLGNPTHLGAFFAFTIAFVPWWGVPLWALGILASKSIAGALAASVAVLIRYRRQWRVAVVVALILLPVAWMRHGTNESFRARLAINAVALQALTYAPIFGAGQGAWAFLGPQLQHLPSAPTVLRWDLDFREVHNDLVQFAFEGGLVAVFLLGGSLWRHRRAFLLPEYGAALAAVGIVSLVSFPFHIIPLMAAAVVICGLAIAEEAEHGSGSVCDSYAGLPH